MFKKIAGAAVVLLAAVLGFAATKPDTFEVQRSATIQAPPEKVFAYVSDFHRWDAWSPYEKLDPAMKRTYSGAAKGGGAVYEWAGNSKAGAGRMEITKASKPSAVTIKLDFTKPFQAHNTTDFTLEGNGRATNVTWAMRGPTPYVGKVMSLFFSMDNMVGKDFETGLANLKTAAEKQVAKEIAGGAVPPHHDKA